jgi:hypothetical protein
MRLMCAIPVSILVYEEGQELRRLLRLLYDLCHCAWSLGARIMYVVGNNTSTCTYVIGQRRVRQVRFTFSGRCWRAARRTESRGLFFTLTSK